MKKMRSSSRSSFKTKSKANNKKEGKKGTTERAGHFWVPDKNLGLAV